MAEGTSIIGFVRRLLTVRNRQPPREEKRRTVKIRHGKTHHAMFEPRRDHADRGRRDGLGRLGASRKSATSVVECADTASVVSYSARWPLRLLV